MTSLANVCLVLRTRERSGEFCSRLLRYCLRECRASSNTICQRLYSSTEGAPLTSSASRVTTCPAHFSRSTQRMSRLAPATHSHSWKKTKETQVNRPGPSGRRRHSSRRNDALVRQRGLCRPSSHTPFLHSERLFGGHLVLSPPCCFDKLHSSTKHANADGDSHPSFVFDGPQPRAVASQLRTCPPFPTTVTRTSQGRFESSLNITNAPMAVTVSATV
jgi:hypothetical protein